MYKATRGGVAIVAIKVMTGETGQRQTNKILEQQELFQNEIHLLKSCRDKNIVQFLGACMEVRQPVAFLCILHIALCP